MMLNGLQTSSKTLPFDAVSAKSQSVDSETSASVSFGSLLKLKEKQLQHEQGASAPVLAAAFVNSQTSLFGTSLPNNNTEVIEVGVELVDLKTTTEAPAAPEADPTEIGGQLSVPDAQITLSGVAKSAAPTIPVDADSVNENISHQAFVETDGSELLPWPPHAKASTFTVLAASTLNLPIQSTDQASIAKEANVTVVTKKDSPSLTSNLEIGSLNVATPPTERFSIPAEENQASSATITMKASPSVANAGLTDKSKAEGEMIITNPIPSPHTARNLEVSPVPSTVDPIAPNIETRESTASHAASVSVIAIGTSEEDESKKNAALPTAIDSIESGTTPDQNSPVRIKISQETSVSKSPVHENPIRIGLKQPDLPTFEAPVRGRLTGEKNPASTNRLTRPTDHSEYSPIAITESIPPQKPAEGNPKTNFETASEKNFADALTLNSQRISVVDESAIQPDASINYGQPSTSPASANSIFSSSAPAENGAAKVELQVTSLVEGQIHYGTQPLRSTVIQTTTTSDADAVGIPVDDSIFFIPKPQSANTTSIDSAHVVEILLNNPLVHPFDSNSHPEPETLVDNISVRERGYSAHPQKFASQADKIQSEETYVDANIAINTSFDQVEQPIYSSSPKNSSTSSIPPGYADAQKSEWTGITSQVLILQDEAVVMDTSWYSAGQAEAKQFSNQEFASRANNFEPRIAPPITKSEVEIGQPDNFTRLENPVGDANKVSREILHTTEMQSGEVVDLVSSNAEKPAAPQQMSESVTYRRAQIVGERLTDTTPLKQAPVDIKEAVRNMTSNSTQSFAETTFIQNQKEPVVSRERFPVADPNDQTNMIQIVADTLTERDDLDTNAAAKSRNFEAEATATKAHSIPGMKKMDLSGSAVSEASPHSEAVFSGRFEPVAFETNDVVTNSSSGKDVSSRFIDAAGNALSTSKSLKDSLEAKVANVPVAPNASVTVQDQPETVAGISFVQTRQGKADMSSPEDKTPEPASTQSMLNSVAAKPGVTSSGTGTSLEISNETEVPVQQVTDTQPNEDPPQPKMSGTEKLRTTAFEAVAKQTNISNISGNLSETGSKVSDAKEDMPAMADISKEMASSNLQASSVVQTMEAVSHPDVTSTTQLSQPTAATRDFETRTNILEHAAAKSPEFSVKHTDTSLEKVSKDPKSGSKQPNAETIFGNPDHLVKIETVEQTDVNVPAEKIHASEKETTVLHSSNVETSGTAHQPGLVASEASSVNGNKFSSRPTGTTLPEIENNITQDTRIHPSTVTENQARNATAQPEAQVERLDLADLGIIESRSSMFGEEANIPQVDKKVIVEINQPKTTTDEDIKLQTELLAKMSEAISRESHDAESQPELARAVEPGIMGVPVDQSANIVPESVQGDKNKAHIDGMSENFNNPFGIPKEHINLVSSELMDESGRAIHPMPVMVESLSDQFVPVSSRHQYVQEPEVSENKKQMMTDEGVSSVEQQPGINQIPGIAMPANGPAIEPPAANLGGNIPSNHLQADVVEVVQQMVQLIKPSLKNRPASMRMQLNPSDLGAIDVQLVSNARGVHVTFFAEQASTGKLLETQLDQLRVSLVDSGVQLSGLDIGQHGQSGQKGGSFEQSPNFSQAVSHNFPKAQKGIQENSGLKRSLGQSTEIDYLI